MCLSRCRKGCIICGPDDKCLRSFLRNTAPENNGMHASHTSPTHSTSIRRPLMADVNQKHLMSLLLQLPHRLRLRGSDSQSNPKLASVDISKADYNYHVGEADRTVYKYERLKDDGLRGLVKSESAKESQVSSYIEEEKYWNTNDYVVMSARNLIQQVGSASVQGKFIEVHDEESDEITISDNGEDRFISNDVKIKFRLPGKISRMLYPHQRDGLKWLWSIHCKNKGGVLADEMGLGKTMQICSFLAGLFHSNLTRRVLIIAPKTLFPLWKNELSKVGLSEETREYFAAQTRHNDLRYVLQDKGVLLTTYGIVRRNAKFLCRDCEYDGHEKKDEIIWDYIILEEGHLTKNPSTKTVESILQVPCLHRIIISGTPLQNDLKELWALFNLCCPGLLGDKTEFKFKYDYFINRGIEKDARGKETRKGSLVAKDLRECIQPYFLRRVKKEVFHDDTALPKKYELIVWLRLTECQRQLYEAFLKSKLSISARDGNPLAALTILKKICDHPLLLTERAAEGVLEGIGSMEDKEGHHVAEELAMLIANVSERDHFVENCYNSCKMTCILSLLGDLVPKGHKVLVFSQTRKMLNLIEESLMANHYKYMRIDGTTKDRDRAKNVEDFQAGCGGPILLLTSKVGGLGLTLTNADRVIVVDPAWNPSTDNQCVDRAHRIGQTKDVIVYRFMTCGTVEEKIYRKQVFKGGLFRSATEHEEQIRYFSRQDLRDLFSMPKHGFDISSTQQQLLEKHDRHHTMEESLRAHVEFLETLNIAGVSQHNLLFSSEAPLQSVEKEEARRLRESTFVENASSRSSVEHNDNFHGGRSLFNPKAIKKLLRIFNHVGESSEHEIGERLNARLRSRGSTFMENASTRSSHEHKVNGTHAPFHPNNIKKLLRNSLPDVKEPSEDEIREKLNACISVLLKRSQSQDWTVDERECIKQMDG